MNYQRIIAVFKEAAKTGDYRKIISKLSFRERIKFVEKLLSAEDEELVDSIWEFITDESIYHLFTSKECSKILRGKKYSSEIKAFGALISRNDDEKIKFIEENSEQLSSVDLSDIVLSIRDVSKKVRTFKKYSDRVISQCITGVINSVNNFEQKSELIDEYGSRLDSRAFSSIINMVDDIGNKTKLIDKCGDKLNSADISFIISSLNGFNLKLEFLDKYKERFNSSNLLTIIDSVDNLEQKMEIIDKYGEKLDSNNFSSILSSIDNLSEKVKLIDKYGERMDSFDITAVIILVDDFEQKKELIDRHIEKLNHFNFFFIIRSTEKFEQKMELLDKYMEKIDPYDILAIIDSVDDFEQKMKIIDKSKHILTPSLASSILITVYDTGKKVKLLDAIGEIMDSSDLSIAISGVGNLGERVRLINKFGEKLNSSDLSFTISLVNNLEQKKILLDKYEQKLTPFDICIIIRSVNDFEQKTELIDKYIERFNSSDFLLLVNSEENFEQRKKLISKYIEELEPYHLLPIIKSEDNLEKKMELIDICIKKLNHLDIESIINSEDDYGRKMALIDRYKDKLSSSFFSSNFSYFAEKILMNKFDSVEPKISDISALIAVQASINFAKRRKIYQARGIDLYLPAGLPEIINSMASGKTYDALLMDPEFLRYYNKMISVMQIDDQRKKALLGALKTYGNRDSDRLFDTNSMNDYEKPLARRVDILKRAEKTLTPEKQEELRTLLYGKMTFKVLKSLPQDKQEKLKVEFFGGKDITPEAFEKLSEEEKEKLKGSLEITTEVLRNLSSEEVKQLEGILGIPLTVDGARKVSQARKEEIEKKLGVKLTNDECKVALLLETLNMSIEDDPELVTAYLKSMGEVLQEEGKDVSQLFLKSPDGKESAEEFIRVFDLATKRVIRKAIEDKDRAKEGGLLTQVSSYALNAEKAIEEAKEKAKLESKVARELLLTEKGKRKIEIERVKDVASRILGVSKEEIKSSDLDKVFEILGYKSERKNWGSLCDLMLEDPRYVEVISSPITPKEKSKLALIEENFVVDKEAQKRKLISALKTAIQEPGYKVFDVIDVIGKNVDKMSASGSRINGLLIFPEIDILGPTNMAQLLMYYDYIKTSTREADRQVGSKQLSPDTIVEYIDRIKKIAIMGSKYSAVLSKEVVSTVSSDFVGEYYTHYLEKLSGRTYRTIPDVEGKFESDGSTLRYRTYDVDDPEQLIAGAIMAKGPKASCFQIGHPQEDTFRYITSSPHGIIVAIEDEEGQFLGRVYGYRVGNAVHFTRMYYNVPFDFEKAMTRIAQDIIDGSEDIDYVTCIPDTSKNQRYIEKNIVAPPEDIDYVQEDVKKEKKMYTDHPNRYISIVASRRPILDPEMVTFQREEITERFYKKRGSIRMVDPKTIEDEEHEEELAAVEGIIYRSDCNPTIIYQLSAAKQIVIGKDWIIVDDGEKMVPIKVKFDETEESRKYEQVVDEEIGETIKMMEQKKAEAKKETEEVKTADKPSEEMSIEELKAIQENIEQAKGFEIGGR